MARFNEGRHFLKSSFPALKGLSSDQKRGLVQPPLEHPCPEGAEVIELPDPREAHLMTGDFREIVQNRESRRSFTPEPISLQALSFLLWATQGVKQVIRGGYATLRTVPSGGARHPFETYILANRVKGIAPGIYRYLALAHKLVFLSTASDLAEAVTDASLGQRFVGDSAAVFIWTVVPYRSEWRYDVASHKTIALDAGHVCQNLYLGCEALGLGTCAIAAYDQVKADALLGLDGEDEFVIYLAPVGVPN